ncbi:VOC family protein [Pseudaminobacter arsenicus]|uniref:VOC family protein n=2 Tax=Borborobacter arsenicus TaxID=1851146 RepID=A0A432V1K1_9HYPH|nr:VOC family protein [Pseudaminobacter arsenicus]
MTAPMEVGLTVSDLPRMRAFYEGALGLAFVSEIHVPSAKAQEAAMSMGGYTVIRLQTPYGERIKLLSPDDAPSVRTGTAHKILDRADSSYVTFIVNDIDGVVARLIAGGAEPMTGDKAVEVRPGTFLSFLRDPEGHIVEIVQYSDIERYRPDLAGTK